MKVEVCPDVGATMRSSALRQPIRPIWLPVKSATNGISLPRTSTGRKGPQNRRESGECRSRNQIGQIIPRSISLVLYLISMTITGTFFIENSIASEITAPNDTSLLSKNSSPIDLSELECDDANTIHLRLLILLRHRNG